MIEILDAKQLADRLQISADQVRKMTADRQIPHIVCGPRLTRYNLDAVIAALQVVQHPDDDAVLSFTEEMSKRMAEKRAEGRNGWETCDPEDLRLKLLRSIADGDAIDVANYCMMLHSLGADTSHTLENWLAQVLHERRWGLQLVPDKQLEAANEVTAAAVELLEAWGDEVADVKPAIERLTRALGV